MARHRRIFNGLGVSVTKKWHYGLQTNITKTKQFRCWMYLTIVITG